jgi:hypothetical protein
MTYSIKEEITQTLIVTDQMKAQINTFTNYIDQSIR